tara:strand:- start:6794 stop:8269 length:1476 start_codon:yes stop_codon:yes gene_type:complete
MLLGSAVHELLEEYVSNGVEIEGDTKQGRIALTAIEHIPESTDLNVELELRMESIDPPLIGFIDLYDTMDTNRPVVLDYKTTSSWDWAKTEQQLTTDPQMIAYGQYALEQHPDANGVVVAHIQLKTRGAPESRFVSVELSRDHVQTEWSKLVDLASTMKEVSRIDDVEGVTPNLSACGAFGGCPYADTCAALGTRAKPFAGIQNLKSENRKKEDDMNRLQELLNKKRTNNVEKTLPPAPNGAAVLSPDAAPRETPTPEEAANSTEITFTSPIPSKDKFTDEQYSEAANELLRHMRDRDVNVIGSVASRPLVGRALDLKRVRPYYVEKTCILSEGTLRFGEDGKVYRNASIPRLVVVEEPKVAPEPEPEVKVEVKGEKPKTPAPVSLKKTKAPAAEPAETLTLYIDCLPMKGIDEAQPFEDVIEPMIKKVAENNGVASPLLMQYGEGKNHVAGLLRVQCPKGKVVISSDNPYWASCKTVLIQSADVVIKGTR